MAGQRLGGRGEYRFGQPVALFEPGRQPFPGDGAGALVILPARPRDVAAHHALEHDGPRHDDSHTALVEVRLRLEQLAWDRLIRCPVVAAEAARRAEPGERG